MTARTAAKAAAFCQLSAPSAPTAASTLSAPATKSMTDYPAPPQKAGSIDALEPRLQCTSVSLSHHSSVCMRLPALSRPELGSYGMSDVRDGRSRLVPGIE